MEHYTFARMARLLADGCWGQEHPDDDKAVEKIAVSTAADVALLELVRRADRFFEALRHSEDDEDRDAPPRPDHAVSMLDAKVGTLLYSANYDPTHPYVVVGVDDGYPLIARSNPHRDKEGRAWVRYVEPDEALFPTAREAAEAWAEKRLAQCAEESKQAKAFLAAARKGEPIPWREND